MQRLIRRRLCSSGELCEKLAKFGEEPAIFYRKAPPDTELADENYPQIILTADKFSDAVRGVSGLLTVDVVCSQMSASPEELEPYVRAELEGIFFAPVDGEIFMLKWQRTDVFQEPASERTPLIIGATVTFEIYEFPTCETSSPDAIQALNEWAQLWDENLTVIGVTEFGEICEPSREKPAIYFDAERTRMTGQTNAAVWLETVVNVHLFAPSVRIRRAWLTEISRALMLIRAVKLLDGSPLRVTACEYNFAANEIQGQVQLTVAYGLLHKPHYAHTLMMKTVEFDGRLKKCTR